MLAAGLRPFLAAPLAPAPHVQRRAGEAGQLHREERVARRDAATAVDGHLRGRDPGELGVVERAQLARGLEATVGAEVLGERRVHGAGDVAGDGIERLRLAAKTL